MYTHMYIYICIYVPWLQRDRQIPRSVQSQKSFTLLQATTTITTTTTATTTNGPDHWQDAAVRGRQSYGSGKSLRGTSSNIKGKSGGGGRHGVDVVPGSQTQTSGLQATKSPSRTNNKRHQDRYGEKIRGKGDGRACDRWYLLNMIRRERG